MRSRVDKNGQEGRVFRSAGATGAMKERFVESVVETETDGGWLSETNPRNRLVRSRGTNDGRVHQTGGSTYVPFSAKELMSSLSSVKTMYFWPRPMVYFPAGTPSNCSRASSETHYLLRGWEAARGTGERWRDEWKSLKKSGKKRRTRRGKYMSTARMPTSWGR